MAVLSRPGLAICFLLTLAVACAPAAPASPTAPKTDAPAKAAAPTSQPASATPAPKAAAQHTAAQAASKPEAITIPRPSGSLVVKVGDTAALTYSDLSLAMTAERLNKEGWQVERISFAQGSEIATEAVAKGEVQLSNVASVSTLRAIQKGAPITMVADAQANEWVVVSTAQITQCADLAGKRVAYHSEGSVSTAMLKTWVDETCQAEPDYLVIAGSENRAVALMGGQIDATPLKMSDWVKISNEQPGKFHVLVNFSEGLSNLSTEPYAANKQWLEQSRPVAVAWLAEILKTNRMIAADPRLILEAAPRLLEEQIEPQVLPEVVEAYQEISIFQVNGGLTSEKVAGTIKFFTGPDSLEPGLTVEQASNLSILEDALELVGGRIPSQP